MIFDFSIMTSYLEYSLICNLCKILAFYNNVNYFIRSSLFKAQFKILWLIALVILFPNAFYKVSFAIFIHVTSVLALHVLPLTLCSLSDYSPKV